MLAENVNSLESLLLTSFRECIFFPLSNSFNYPKIRYFFGIHLHNSLARDRRHNSSYYIDPTLLNKLLDTNKFLRDL